MPPIQIHIFFWATFASLIAPFGGFFASGLKRTFKIKDFGDSIPGHGGMTDRMDCQFIMGFFAYIYYHTFLAVNKASLGDIMEMAITGLTVEEQIELVRGMGRYLGNQGLVGPEVSREAHLSVSQMNRPRSHVSGARMSGYRIACKELGLRRQQVKPDRHFWVLR